MIILEMFHENTSLSLVLLLMLVGFMSGFRLELMYIPHIASIRSNLNHLHSLAHRNHFFHLYQQNKSSESKGKFRQASNCCKRVLEASICK